MKKEGSNKKRLFNESRNC